MRERRPEACPGIDCTLYGVADAKIEATADCREGESLKEEETHESQTSAIALETSQQTRQPARGSNP